MSAAPATDLHAIAVGRRAGDQPADTFVVDPLKITMPQRRDGTVDRTRLVERLRTAPHQPLVLVTAGAGYGKTTSVAQWCEADERAVAWVSIDELDNDPVFFLRNLALALDRVEPLPGDVFEPLMRSSPPILTVVVPRLGRALLARRTPTIIVLDDIHLAPGSATVECLDGLIRHLPAGSQLVLAGRSLPDLRIARLRLQHGVVEIGPDDLAMDPGEASGLLEGAGLQLSKAELEDLVDHTEGWPAGLSLAALALRDAGSGIPGLEAFGGDHRYVAEYLRDELLASLPHDVVAFLVESSVLQRLSGPRCDAVLERTGSGQLLEELARSRNLFVIPLDDQQRWYRLHHLFADLLAAELRQRDPALEQVLHRRASTRCEAEGDVDGAIRHALDGGDVERAGDLVLRHALAYAGSGRNATVGLWLDRFDDEQIEGYAPLALATAWYRLGRGDTDLVEHWLAVAAGHSMEGPLADGTPSLRAEVAILRAVLGSQGLTRMAGDADEARAACVEGTTWWGVATVIAGLGRSLAGDAQGARDLFERAIRASVQFPPARAASLAHLAFVEIEADDWEAAERLVHQALDETKQNGLDDYFLSLPVHAVAALVMAHQGSETEARRQVRHTQRLLRGVGYLAPRVMLVTYVLLARAEVLLGDLVAARAFFDEADDRQALEPEATFLIDQIERLRTVLGGEPVGGPANGAAGGPSSLTTAELRVLEYLPTHLSLKEIGEKLFVSRNTVKTQAIATYRKLGVSSRGDAVDVARRLGLIET